MILKKRTLKYTAVGQTGSLPIHTVAKTRIPVFILNMMPAETMSYSLNILKMADGM